jgi:hypothetical protein
MEELISLFKDMMISSTYGIEIGMVCRVETYKASAGRMDVKPLLKTSDGYSVNKNFPILSNISLSTISTSDYIIKVPYQRGDLVWVTFSANDIRDALQGINSTKTKARFNMQDACAIGGVEKESIVPPVNQLASLDGLVLGTRDKSAYIQIKPNEINLKAISIKVSDGINEYELNKHIHISGAPGTPSGEPEDLV